MRGFAVGIGWVMAVGFSISTLATIIRVSESSREVSVSGLTAVMVVRAIFILAAVGLILYGRKKPPLD